LKSQSAPGGDLELDTLP